MCNSLITLMHYMYCVSWQCYKHQNNLYQLPIVGRLKRVCSHTLHEQKAINHFLNRSQTSHLLVCWFIFCVCYRNVSCLLRLPKFRDKTSPAPIAGPAPHYIGFTVRLLRYTLEMHSCHFKTVAFGSAATHSNRLCSYVNNQNPY
jgi:hypothetical protein